MALVSFLEDFRSVETIPSLIEILQDSGLAPSVSSEGPIRGLDRLLASLR